jgi:hypothetical protein
MSDPQGAAEKQQVNHANAPQNVAGRFGTDLAPLAAREDCAG